MIAKRVERAGARDSSFENLAWYILDKSNNGKKVAHSWTRNCLGTDNDMATKEIVATQAMNQRTKNDKTYHLVISFQEGECPSLDDLKAIEEHVCEKIGYQDHQRLVAVHNDTDNLHFHVAINKVHPETYRAIEPYYDKFKLDEACRECEIRFGLKVDQRIDHKKRREGFSRANAKAEDMERHSGLKSFHNWVKEHAIPVIDRELAGSAPSWEKLHEGLAEIDLVIRKRGAGFVISHRSKKLFVKASFIKREYSKAKLEKVLGPFREAESQKRSRVSYEKGPLHRHKDTSQLYQLYLSEKDKKKSDLKEEMLQIRKGGGELFQEIVDKYALKRRQVKLDPIIRKQRKRNMYRKIQEQKEKEIKELKDLLASRRQLAFTHHKTLSWQQWLIHQAECGNTQALEVLKTGKVKKKEGPDVVSGREKSGSLFEGAGISKRVRSDGSVVYSRGRQEVIDHGQKISVKGDDQGSVELAMQLARAKFGTELQFAGSEKFKSLAQNLAARKEAQQKDLDRKNYRGPEL